MEIKYDNEAEKHTFGKILGIAAAVVPEDKEIQALVEKIVAADTKKFDDAPWYMTPERIHYENIRT